MKLRLATRLTIFFLTALAAVLAGFSITLFVLAAKYLNRQADERLEAALDTLVAAAEIRPQGVEWEPQERRLSFGRRTLVGQFSWRVGDDKGVRLDGSSSGEADRILADQAAGLSPAGRVRADVDLSGTPWRIMTRRLAGPKAAGGLPDGPGRPKGWHDVLVFGAALSLEAVRGTLRNLALALAGLSAGIWVLCLVFVRRLCQRALRPVAMMAEAARSIGGHGLDERLPLPGTRDELEDLGRSFNDLLDRLHESFERQRRFTGDASHQLRTPLTAMQGQLELALRQERPAEEYRRVLTLVQGRVRHVRQIVESLLFLARADAEALEPQPEPVELRDWTREHLQSWTGPRASDVRLDADSATGPLWVRAQPALLGELVNNLIENAAAYSEPATPIVVHLGREGNDATLTVEDSGIGIAAEEIPHLFEPFYRAPRARRLGSSGLGLGLSVAARLARLFGGWLEVTSQQERGSRFTLKLPLAQLPRPVSNDEPGPPGDRHDAVAQPARNGLPGAQVNRQSTNDGSGSRFGSQKATEDQDDKQDQEHEHE